MKKLFLIFRFFRVLKRYLAHSMVRAEMKNSPFAEILCGLLEGLVYRLDVGKLSMDFRQVGKHLIVFVKH